MTQMRSYNGASASENKWNTASRIQPSVAPSETPRGAAIMASQSLNSKSWWPDVTARMHSFMKLPQNWDSYHGQPSTPTAYVAAIQLLASWTQTATRQNDKLPRPNVSPCGDGSIVITFRQGRKELEVGVPAQPGQPYEWVTAQTGREDHDGMFRLDDIEKTNPLVRWLLAEK